ncbi:MAG: hypothetical protein F6J93_36465 [Oscillatoria sp. SIO1A7]|nr:hypothetical protein [Oscillatoria sp. SIO1A7]
MAARLTQEQGFCSQQSIRGLGIFRIKDCDRDTVIELGRSLESPSPALPRGIFFRFDISEADRRCRGDSIPETILFLE